MQLVTIGRASDNVISLTEPRVSRLHAELILREGQWILQSHGRNGTWIQGTRVEKAEMSNLSIFQLGSSGPTLQILIQETATDTRTATLENFQASDFEFLEFDRDQLADEVTRIVETDAFRQLQSQSQQRRPLDSSSDESQPIQSQDPESC